MTSAHGPQSPSLPPWLRVSTEPASGSVSAPPPAPPSATAPASAPKRAVIDGRACRTRATFFTEVARVLRLPDYFGHNWDALTDAFRDLLGAPPDHSGRTEEQDRAVRLSLVVQHAEELLSAEPPAQFATFLNVLATAAAISSEASEATEATEATEVEAKAGEAAGPAAPLSLTLCTDADHEQGLLLRVTAALA